MRSAQDRTAARDVRFGIFESMTTSFPSENIGTVSYCPVPGVKKIKFTGAPDHEKVASLPFFSPHLTRALCDL
jgi:hypothetical protein